MFNPHIHHQQQQQQQQQQQFHQHLRQLQQLFQQQQPPPPPPPQPPPGHHVPHHHHHQTPRPIPVAPQTAPPPRMVNLCQATQTTIIAPNPMLQGALLMQQMQGNMRGFGMGGQQFRQFFAASNRSSLLGPVPMGMAIKSPIMGFPAARPFHPHARFFNNSIGAAATPASSSSSVSTTDAAAHEMDRKRDSEQMTTESTDDQHPGTDITDKSETEGNTGGVEGHTQPPEDQSEEPALKKQRTEGSEESKEQCAVEVISADTDEELSSDSCSNTEDIQPEDDILLEEGGSAGETNVERLEESRASEVHTFSSGPSPSGRLNDDDQQANLPLEEMSHDKDAPLSSPNNQAEGEEGVADGANKFYCYLCSITCHNQQNFRSHMNSVSHQQRMMEIQHMSNACLVTLLPRVQESLQGTSKDGEKKEEQKHWCPTCQTHFTSSVTDHRRTEEHKLASRAIVSSCTICKKHFRSSQVFVEHLQSLEHRQKVEKLQEDEDCEASSKLPAMEADGLSLEKEEEGEQSLSEGEQDYSVKQDGWSSFKEVTLRDMSSDEQYDPDTVYGASFFVPVAGFICRLCSKFFHFESSAVHTHCKSVTHFEKLKSYKEILSEKGKAVASSREPLCAADSPGPPTESSRSSSAENPSSGETGVVRNSVQSTPALSRLKENQQPEDHAEPNAEAQVFSSSAEQELLSREDETVSLPSAVQETPVEFPVSRTEEPEPGAAAKDDDEEERKEVPAVPGNPKNSGKATPKRRSGRVTNRR